MSLFANAFLSDAGAWFTVRYEGEEAVVTGQNTGTRHRTTMEQTGHAHRSVPGTYGRKGYRARFTANDGSRVTGWLVTA